MTSLMVPDHFSRDEITSYDRLVAEISGLPPEDGIGRVKQFLMTYPSFPQAHNDLGVLYHRAGNSTLALAHYEKAVRLQPDNVTFRKNLADFYAAVLGWFDDAVDIYLEILKRNPRDTEALIALGQLGNAMEGKGALPEPEAAPALQAPTAPAPPSAPVGFAPAPVPPIDTRSSRERHEAATARATQGDVVGAIAELKDLLRIDPACAPAHNDLAVLSQQAGDLDAALAGHCRAVELQPDNSTYRKNLADFLLVCRQDFQGALEQYNALLTKNPRDVEVLRALAHLCLEMDKLDDARFFFEKALAVEPWNRDLREALQKLREPISPTPAAPPVAPVVSAISAPATAPPTPAGAAKPISDLYRDAVELAKDDTGLRESKLLLETVVQLDPAHALAHNDLGVVCFRLGDIQAAERHYRRAVELEPESVNFRKNLADLYFAELGKTDDAIYIYLDLMKKHPRDVEVLLNLGHICTAVGHGAEAKSFYRRALEIEPWNKDARLALQAPA